MYTPSGDKSIKENEYESSIASSKTVNSGGHTIATLD